jgi:chromosome segregation ATPase
MPDVELPEGGGDSASNNDGGNNKTTTKSTKKRRKKGSGAHSRTKRGDNSKRHRAGAAVESFRANPAGAGANLEVHVEEAAEAMEEDACQQKQNQQQKEKKSLQNKVNYQKRKIAKSQEKMEDLQKEVEVLAEEKEDLEAVDRKRQSVVKSLEASANKAWSTLDARTERWTSYKEKRDAEIYLVRRAAKRRVLALEKKHEKDLKKHEKDLAQEKSRNYKSEREQAKSIVNLASDINEVKSAAYKDAAMMEEYYEAKLAEVR